MYEHHEKAIERIAERFQSDPAFLAMLVGGSIAKGRSLEDSDVDLLLIATDEEFARREAALDLTYFDFEVVEYPGSYVEGKIINQSFLNEVADHGSEPARSAFVGAIIVFSRLPELDRLLARITTYSESERETKMRAFTSQMAIYHWYLWDAERRQNYYQLSWAASNLVLFGGRLILAHNRILFPYHKWFLPFLSLAPAKPEHLLEQIDTLLHQPNTTNASVFMQNITSFLGLQIDLNQAARAFVRDTEWSWRDGKPAVGEW
jgi:predicted nucleotidyltransferase